MNHTSLMSNALLKIAIMMLVTVNVIVRACSNTLALILSLLVLGLSEAAFVYTRRWDRTL